MRDRRQPRSNRRHRTNVHALDGIYRAAPIARIFTPSELDLDDLAEAIRLLLGDNAARRSEAPDQPDSNLLSSPGRGSHVLEATEVH
jgi:hypothetical protein